MFKIDPTRSGDVLLEVLGKEFNGVLGCSYFSAYRRYMRECNVIIQFCLAHLGSVQPLTHLVDYLVYQLPGRSAQPRRDCRGAPADHARMVGESTKPIRVLGSQVVIDEASVGDATEIQERLAIIRGLPILKAIEEVEALAQAIMAAGMLPAHAERDAAHVAVAAIHGVDYLLTWNCKHLANAQISRRIALVCEKQKS